MRRKYEASTTLVPPILREAVLEAKTRTRMGNHVLVYLTGANEEALVATLNRVEGVTFVVYGLGERSPDGHCTFKAFSETGFIEDLTSARAVVANGGSSLLGEAIFLGKPVYSVPLHKQFEQIMNARNLEQLGYGVAANAVDAEALSLFLRDGPHYAAAIASHQQDGNSVLYGAIDGLLARYGSAATQRCAPDHVADDR